MSMCLLLLLMVLVLVVVVWLVVVGALRTEGPRMVRPRIDDLIHFGSM